MRRSASLCRCRKASISAGSTATVRRAQDQIQALFARPLTQVFPPPGPDRRDSFFARTMSARDVPARLYVGIAAQGRNPKVMMRKTLVDSGREEVAQMSWDLRGQHLSNLYQELRS